MRILMPYIAFIFNYIEKESIYPYINRYKRHVFTHLHLEICFVSVI